jgi:hypothetical protein
MRRSPLAGPVLGTLLTSTLLLAGCGGDEVDPKVAYVEQATGVCDEAQRAFEALATPTTPEGFAPYANDLVGILETAQTELTGLTPPPDDRAELESRVLEPFGEVVEEGKAFAEEVEAAGTDQAKLLALIGQQPSAAGVDTEYLRTYGLPTCADAIEQAG